MLAIPLLRKRPIKAPNLKSVRPFFPSHEHVKGFLSKYTILKVDLIQDHQMYCLQACMCVLYSREILKAEAVKGFIRMKKKKG